MTERLSQLLLSAFSNHSWQFRPQEPFICDLMPLSLFFFSHVLGE